MKRTDALNIVPSLAKMLLLIVMLMSHVSLFADGQKQWRNMYADSYIGVGTHIGAGGLSPVGFNGASQSMGFSYGFDVSYSGGFGSNFGFLIGVSVNMLSSGVNADELERKFIDDFTLKFEEQGSLFTGRAHYGSEVEYAKETYSTVFLEFPVMLTYSTESDWFVNAGVKFAIPLSLKSEYKYGDVRLIVDEVYTTGTTLKYYEESHYEGGDGSYDPFASSSATKHISVLAALEFGYRLQFANANSLQFSLFGDYGISSIGFDNDDSDRLFNLNFDRDGLPTTLDYKGLLNDGEMSGLRYFKFGLRIQYNFGIGKVQRSGRPVRSSSSGRTVSGSRSKRSSGGGGRYSTYRKSYR